MRIDVLSVLCSQLTRDLLVIAKFLFGFSKSLQYRQKVRVVFIIYYSCIGGIGEATERFGGFNPPTVLRATYEICAELMKNIGVPPTPPVMCEYACPGGTSCNIFRKPIKPVSPQG